MLLPLTNLPAVIFIRENKIGLHPGDTRTGVNQELANTLSIHPAILIQLFPARFGDGLNPALHGNTMRPAQKVERLFIPEINPGLKADLYWTLSNAFQQPPDVPAYAKDLINTVAVLDAPPNKRIYVLQ